MICPYSIAKDIERNSDCSGAGNIYQQAADLLRQQAEEINNLKQWQNRMLDVIKNLEAQVYGGTTK